ncbi:MAG: DUF3429 domain-containing protein [Psychromonas sp.]
MKITKQLGFMGLIPFIGSLVLSLQNISVDNINLPNMAWQVDGQFLFIAYSAVILSFMAGTLWQANQSEKKVKQNIISNVFSLFAFFALLTPTLIAVVILAFNYLVLFLYESRYVDKQDNISAPYMKMRLQLTLVVVSLHIAAFIFWLS